MATGQIYNHNIYIYSSNDNNYFYSLRPNGQGNLFMEIKKGKRKVKK